jgi:hypothetical protein
MRRMIFISFLLFLFVGVAYADNFQIIDRNSGFYIAYSPVYCDGTLQGYTDKYGRIIINLPTGSHRCEVIYRNQRRSLTLNVDGSRDPKIIYLN